MPYFLVFCRFQEQISADILTREFTEIQQHLENSNMPISMCHNDVHGSNVLYDEETGKLSTV